MIGFEGKASAIGFELATKNFFQFIFNLLLVAYLVLNGFIKLLHEEIAIFR